MSYKRNIPWIRQPQTQVKARSQFGITLAAVAGERNGALLNGVASRGINTRGRYGRVVLGVAQTFNFSEPVGASWSLILNLTPVSKGNLYPYFLGISGGANAFALAIQHDSIAGRAAWYDGTNLIDSGLTFPLGELHTLGLSFDGATNTYRFYKNGVAGNTFAGLLTGTGTWQFASATGEAATLDFNLIAISNKWLDNAAMQSLTANPWLLFEPLKRNIYVEAAASGVSGTIAVTLDAFTSAITATTTITGSIAQTVAGAVSAFTGNTTVTGTIAKTLENDVGNLQGSTGSTTGTIAVTAQNDTASMSGKTTIVGTMNASTENATSNATGSTTIVGQMAASVSNFIAAMTDAVGGVVARLLSLLGVGS